MKEEAINQAQEADILEKFIIFLVNLIQSNLKKIFFIGLIGGIVGGGLSYLVPKQYRCSIQILPEFNNSNGSDFSSLANLAGINLGQGAETDAFRPDLYPTVLTSTTAVIYLLRQPVETSKKKKYTSLIEYLSIDDEEKPVGGQLQSTLTNPVVWRFTKPEKNLIEDVRKRINSSFDKKSGTVSLDIEMPDPEVSAVTTALLTTYLQNFLSDYRTQKKRDKSSFLDTRVKAAKSLLDKAEYALQNYRDKNRNVVSNVAQIHEQKLQFEFLQRQGVHTDLVNQSEKAKIEELQSEKVLITVESPTVPLGHSSPRRIFYAVGGSILSLLLAFIIAIIRLRNK